MVGSRCFDGGFLVRRCSVTKKEDEDSEEPKDMGVIMVDSPTMLPKLKTEVAVAGSRRRGSRPTKGSVKAASITVPGGCGEVFAFCTV